MEEKKEKDLNWLLQWVKHDFVYIVIIIFALGCCMYVLSQVDTIDDACNAHWEQQIKDYCTCGIGYEPTIYGVDLNETWKEEGERNS